LAIMELAIGKFPFDASEHLSDGDGAPAGILDLLQQIVYEPAPKLPKSEAFPQILEDMIQSVWPKLQRIGQHRRSFTNASHSCRLQSVPLWI